MKIYSIPGKIDVEWNENVKAIIDTWTTYFLTLEEFKEAVLVKGINHAKANGGVAWIIDSSRAKGVLSEEIQKFIDTDIFPAFSRIGLKYFITITSTASALTQSTINTYSAKAGPYGIELVELNSVNDAIMWLRNKSV
jgi:hypothetical protein